MDEALDIAFLIFFLGIAPPAGALLANDIVEEEAGAWLRAWVEARMPAQWAYLFNCPVCMSHWTMAAFTLLATPMWAQFTFCPGWLAAVLCWGAATRVAIRYWLRP